MSLYNNIIQNKILKGSYDSRDVLILAFALVYMNLSIAAFCSLNGKNYPYTTFLNNPNSRFEEFFKSIKALDGLKIVDTWENSNPFEDSKIVTPLAANLYTLCANLIQLIGNKYIILLALYAIILIMVFQTSKRNGNDRSIFLLTILSYPMLFALDRGAIFLAIFLLLFFALTTKEVTLATLALAVSLSLKLPTLIFILPILFNRSFSIRWLAYVCSLLLMWLILINLIAVQVNNYYLVPSVLRSISLFQGNTHFNPTGLAYGSSVFMPVYYLVHNFQIIPWLKSYQVTLIIFSALGVWLILKGQFISSLKNLQSAKSALYFSCLSFVAFMPVTEDYYLLVFLLPLLIFPNTSFSFGYFLAFGFLLGAKNVLFFPTTFAEHGYISIQVFINPPLILILLLAEFNLIDFINRDDSKSTANESVVIRFLIASGAQSIVFIKQYKRSIVLFLGITIAVAVLLFRIQLSDREAYNTTAGLPIDFDPGIYLELNPGLEEYWQSLGIIHKDKVALWNHAEQHYIGFGSNDGWKYRGSLQKILYNKYLPINRIAWQLFLIPIILLAWSFSRTLISIQHAYRSINFLSTANKSVVIRFLIATGAQSIVFIKQYKRSIVLFLGITIAVAVLLFRIQLSDREAYNTTAGLPIDFDPGIYLELNPGLEEYWQSVGIVHKDKQALWNHAEQHYIGFGSNDGWKYNGSFQKILYNKYLPINRIAWQWFQIPIIILLWSFMWPLISTEHVHRSIQFLRFHKIKIMVTMAVIIFASAVISGAPYVLRILHNKEIGIPLDFDPEMYLKMNPQLEQYWKSIGVKHQSKQALLEHAELHYRDFGAKDGWQYK